MLSKNDIIKRMKELDFELGEYWLTSGASMVMWGVKSNTKDIDLGCTSKMMDEFERKGYPVEILQDRTRRLEFATDIEIYENWVEGDIVLVEDIPTVTLDGIIMMKEKLNREKDTKDIEMIKQFLK